MEEKLRIQETFLREKARIKWTRDRYRNSTAFYHAMLRVRKAKKPLAVLKINDDLVDNQQEIKTYMINFCQTLFSNNRTEASDFLSLTPQFRERSFNRIMIF